MRIYKTQKCSNLTYDGNRSVIAEHHRMKPNVIIMAEVNVKTHDVTPNNASRKRPRKDASNCFMANLEIL